MNRIFLALAALIFISPCAPATEPSISAAVVYYGTDRSVPPRDEKLALASFQRHYRVTAAGENDRFTPPRVITRTYPRTSPGGTLLPNGTVRFAAIVTPGGLVTKPIILDTPSDYLSSSVLGVLRAWRCKPALLNGTPVAALLIYDFTVRRSGGGQQPPQDNGLGHLRSGDR